ncbi:hypothetical protein DN402_08490 [Streptomyces sp. SW4]|nr:hypothetical protein DN402_08490 [Streptomyces sp. SW4]
MYLRLLGLPRPLPGTRGDGGDRGGPGPGVVRRPYFTVHCGPGAGAAGFRPFTDLLADRAARSAYVAEVGRRLGTGPDRVAASTLHIGTAARLWSVALATAALTGRAPDLSPGRLHWRIPETGPVDLWLPEPAAATGRDLPDALYETVHERTLRPLGEALRRDTGLSPKVLHGNVTSALTGALRVLHTRLPGTPLAPSALVGAVLEREPLASAGTFDAATLDYRRHSCCLCYRVRAGGYCGDCVLVRPPRTGRRGQV